MNGFEFLKNLRAQKDFCNLPVVIYTTSSRLSDIQEARSLGAKAFLTKPHDIRTLESKLRTAFDLNYSSLSSLQVIV
jgi:DNA-binding response OmpR family regulator